MKKIKNKRKKKKWVMKEGREKEREIFTNMKKKVKSKSWQTHPFQENFYLFAFTKHLGAKEIGRKNGCNNEKY